MPQAPQKILSSSQIVCQACGERNKTFIRDQKLGVFTCGSCSHVFTVLPDGYEESYEEKYFSEDHKNWFLNPDLKLFKLLCDDIKRYFGSKSDNKLTLLDAGCGNGDFLKFCKRYLPNTDLYGIDLSENKEAEISFFTGDFLTFPLPKKFDVITGMMVAEHIPDLEVFVKRIRELLKPGGIVILTTINSDGLIYRIANALKRLGVRGPFDRLYNHHHLQHFTFKSFGKLMENNGLKVVIHRAHNYPLAAVDLPDVNGFLKTIYFIGVAMVFKLTYLNGGGMCQTIICKQDL